MGKAERYIELVNDENGHLCDLHALKAVEIAKEEMIEKGIKFLKDHLEGYDIFGSDIKKSIESFKLAMKYE